MFFTQIKSFSDATDNKYSALCNSIIASVHDWLGYLCLACSSPSAPLHLPSPPASDTDLPALCRPRPPHCSGPATIGGELELPPV